MLSVIWAIPWVRRLSLYAGIVLAIIALCLVIYFKGRAAGKLTAAIDSMTKTLATERRMRDASASSPSDRDGVSRRLRDHKF